MSTHIKESYSSTYITVVQPKPKKPKPPKPGDNLPITKPGARGIQVASYHRAAATNVYNQ